MSREVVVKWTGGFLALDGSLYINMKALYFVKLFGCDWPPSVGVIE